jgi:hypothetical protein
MRRLLLAVIAAVFAVTVVGFAQADPGTHSVLTATSGQGSGRVEFSATANQDNPFDVQATINISGTTPNTDFIVSRAPDPPSAGTGDGICTGTTWIPLSPPLTTSAGGAGATHFHVLPNPAVFPEGRIFDVKFRVVGTDGTVFQSDCFTVTVK